MDKTVPSYHTNFPLHWTSVWSFYQLEAERISSTVTTDVASQVVLWLSWSFSSLQRFFLSSSREYCFPLCENFSRDLSEQVCQKLNCNLSAFVFAVLYVGYLTSVWFVHKCIDFISFVSFCFCSNFLCCTLAVSSCLLTRSSSHFFSIAFLSTNLFHGWCYSSCYLKYVFFAFAALFFHPTCSLLCENSIIASTAIDIALGFSWNNLSNTAKSLSGATFVVDIVPYSVKLWWWKSLMKFDEWSMSESLTSKTLTNSVSFLFALVKINYCRIIMCLLGLRTCKFHISVLELGPYKNF